MWYQARVHSIYKQVLLHIEYLWHVDPQQKNGPEADEDYHSCKKVERLLLMLIDAD